MAGPSEYSAEEIHRNNREESSEGYDGNGGRPPKRPRAFIARQACESCRQKKSRCDEDVPCGPCRSSGAECHYGQRRATKNEFSIGMIMNGIKRLEAKIDKCITPATTAFGASAESNADYRSPLEPVVCSPPAVTHFNEAGSTIAPIDSTEPVVTLGQANAVPQTPISFSALGVLFWPAVEALLPEEAKDLYEPIGEDLPFVIESKRPMLGFSKEDLHDQADENCLTKLRITTVRELCDAYFSTFNLCNPVIDRDSFFQNSLGVAINGDFGVNIESCLVLVVMALGCSGRKAFVETGLKSRLSRGNESRISQDRYSGEGFTGLDFFNEARRRIGFVLCDGTIQSCQFYILASFFFANIVRPLDSWAMISRASISCIIYWDRSSKNDEWEHDMQSRLYWIALMHESIMAQELNLSVSRMQDFEEAVPLPKFVKFNSGPSVHLTADKEQEMEEAFYHYHFLSQIAHRMILTRVRNTIFYSNTTGTYPKPALEEELIHQVEQWREQLPTGLRFDSNSPELSSESSADILVVSWLQSRYYIIKYHIGRPLLHKVLHNPEHLTPTEAEKCKATFGYIKAWMPYMKLTLVMKDCIPPIKYGLCVNALAALVLMYCFKSSPHVALHEALPADYAEFALSVLKILEEFSSSSPVVRIYHKIALILCGKLTQ